MQTWKFYLSTVMKYLYVVTFHLWGAVDQLDGSRFIDLHILHNNS